MATNVLGLKTFASSDPVDYNEVNDNYTKIDNGVKTAMQGRAAQNLLDNSNFSNYVNQRGGTSTAGDWNYCIDRWRAFGTGGQLVWHNSNHVALGALRGINQAIENKSRFVGKTYTIAVKDTDGVLYITSGFYGGDDKHIWTETNGMELRLYSVSDDNNIYFSLKNLSSDTSKFINLKWAALYEGSYTADTLPAYVPKGYAYEMAECQRYYYQTTISNAVAVIASGHAHTSEIARFVMTLPQPMRIKPSFSFTVGSYIRIMQNGSTFNGTDISLNDAEDSTKQKMIFFVTSSGLTSYAQAGLMIPGSTLKFSADL